MSLAARIILNVLVLLAMIWATSSHSQQATEQDKAQKEQQLAAIQTQIEERLEAVAERQRELTDTEVELRELEEKTAAIAARLRNTQRQAAALEQRITANQQRQQQLLEDKRKQQKLLAQQVANAYTNGDNDFLKLLLNQQDPADLERLLSYYQYFNQARMQQIDELQTLVEELAALEQTLTAQRQQLNQLQQQQQRQQTALRQQQSQQEAKLAELQQQQRSDKATLEDLQQSREQLEQVIVAIEEALQADVQLVGLKPVKSSLSWPAQGKVRRLFGERREGPLRWKGILIEGDNGQSVRSIADGRVLFADWLRGFGLVIVVDHGEGYMTLYGHNQALLKNTGEEVQQNEEIALMGQTGGRSRPTLYFEIRYRGKPQNPTGWISR